MEGTTVANIAVQITSNAQTAIASLQKLSTSTKTSSSSMKGLEKDVKNISNATQKMSGSFNSLGKILSTKLGFGSLQQSINSFVNLGIKSVRNAIDLTESYNLFTVSMKNGTDTMEEYNANLNQALEFQNDLNSAFGVSIASSMKYQGYFKNLASSLGLSNTASVTLSENLTKLTYDLASLYNTDFSTMYSKLQSGLVGQTKPLRSVGVDVTMQTLQPTLYSLNINKKVSELTQAQKVMLRYIEILRQTTSAQGDMARTIEAPANQIRILKDQWTELTMWLGTFFIGALSKVLPYMNGIVMAFKNIFKFMSDLFGFKLSDWEFVNAVQSTEDITGLLDESVDSAEELKKSLAGFDELNILGDQPTTDNFMAEDLSVTLALEDAMAGYDNLMDSVKTKASKISQEFLNWLGYTTDTDGNIIGINNNMDRTLLLLGSITSAIAIPTFVSLFSSFYDEIAKVIVAILSYGTVMASDGVFATSLMTIGDIVATAALPLAGIVIFVAGVIAAIVQLFNEATDRGELFRKYFSDFVNSFKRLLDSFTSVFAPMLEPIGRLFNWVWENGVKVFWDGFVNMVASVSVLIMELWLTLEPVISLIMMALGGLAGLFVDVFGGVIAGAFYLLFGILGEALNIISFVIFGITNIINSFRTNWNETWQSIADGFVSIFNGMLNFFGGIVTSIINGINSIIQAYNKIPLLPDIPTIPTSNVTVITPKYTPTAKDVALTTSKITKSTNIGLFADGGFPTVGEMFIAREAGAEMVGSIGGRTAVANNQDIVSAVSKGVAQAVASVMNGGNGQTVELIVDDMTFGRVVINSANKVQKNTNLKLQTF